MLTKRVITKTGCLHELFEDQVDSRPHETALICGEESLSYKELEHKSNQLAHHLRSCGVGPGMLVGLCLDRSVMPYIAILAILKAGAGYVPIDPNYPPERIRHIIIESGISIVLTEQTLSSLLMPIFTGRTILMDSHYEDIIKNPTDRLSCEESGVDPNDLCYIIYTSGSTGRPKGVMIEHRSVVHFVSAFNETCQITDSDRIYQGFSLGFDGSVEEMWMAWSNGATVVAKTKGLVPSGSDVARFLTEKKVTVFSTVPTFLSMIETELPTVRLLIVSGEQCQPQLVQRWAQPDRRMLNVYGPTEGTVNTTVSECTPGKPVTIGKPLRGYHLFIMDEKLQPASHGEPGELFIGGTGLARGYMNQPEMTAAQFVSSTCVDQKCSSQRLYRTGDLVQATDDGDLQFLGRIDNQVKIRGFRVELSEIETVLLEHPLVRAAAVKISERENIQKLAAYVIPDNSAAFDRNSVLDLLHRRLPEYMVPGYLDLVDEFPRLASGKVDRHNLPEPVSALVRTERAIIAPRSDLERQITGVWEKVFKVSPISIEDDFFYDLGGHSLLAAQMVSLLRNDFKLEVSIRDTYQYPTIKQLAEHLDSSTDTTFEECIDEPDPGRRESSRRVFESLSRLTRWSCITLQSVSLYLIYGLGTVPAGVLLLMFLAVEEGRLSLDSAVWVSVLVTLGVYPAMLALSIIVKWLVIGRYKAGRYPVWGPYYFRWWLVTRFQALSGAGLLAGTPLMSLYYYLMGAKVGPNCIIDTPYCSAFDLVTIGEDTSIGAETHLLGYRVEDGMLNLGSVDIGSRCFIGIHSVLGLNSRMGDDARLDDLSLLEDREVIADGESRRGSPSQPAPVKVPGASEDRISRRPLMFGLLHLITIYAMELFLVLTALPTVALFYFAYLTGDYGWLIISLIIAGPLYMASFCIMLAALKAVVLGRAKPGIYPVESGLYLQKWFIDNLMRISRRLVLPLYTTIYFPPWLRLLGAKIGARSEISTVRYVSPDLLVASDESFFADGCIIGGRRIFRGVVEVAENRIGRRSFVGNSAILPTGNSLGNGCLVGVLSSPPVFRERTPDGSEWLGSPSFQLPHHQKVGGFDETVTYRPSTKLYIQRLIIDALRIFIPGMIEISGVVAFVLLFYVLYKHLAFWALMAIFPLLGMAIAIGAALCVIGVKKLLIGRFKPLIKPLWSVFVWLNEAVNGAYEAVAAPALSPMLGTPFFSRYLRLLGCKVGRHVFLETTLFSEFDLVDVGDYASLNLGAVIQNHLFEDRIMKASYLRIGDECSIGNAAVVLYDTEMKQGASLRPLSLLMKGEILPSFSSWHGIPSKRAASITSRQCEDKLFAGHEL